MINKLLNNWRNKMKTLLTFILLLGVLFLVPTAKADDSRVDKVTSNWHVFYGKDDFTDVVSCAVIPSGQENLFTLFTTHEVYPHIVLRNNRGIGGAGLKYRVDKGETVELGDMYSTLYSESYFISGENLENLIKAFSAGTSVVMEIIPKNKYSNNTSAKYSLKGFSKAYAISKKCKY